LDAADHLVKKCGADKVYIIATHGVLSGDAVKKIEACDSVYKVNFFLLGDPLLLL
jgi:ribose-phosphate pyrophosphokinase